jgi:hypothetical protein
VFNRVNVISNVIKPNIYKRWLATINRQDVIKTTEGGTPDATSLYTGGLTIFS